MDVPPVADRCRDGPLGGGSEATAIAFGIDFEHFDFANFCPGAALAGKLKTTPGLEVCLGKEVAADAVGEGVVNDLFVAEVEGPVDVVEEG